MPVCLEAHLARLTRGTRFLGMAAPPAPEALRAFLEAHSPCRALAHGVLRLVAVDQSLHVLVAPWAAAPPAQVEVALSRQGRRFSGSPLNRFKTLSYLENRLLAKEAERRGLFEVIARNERDQLTDGSRTSIFLLIDGELLTPPVADGALPGVARGVLLKAGLARVAHLQVRALGQAQALLLSNALRGAIPVDGLDGRALAVGHPLLVRAVALLAGGAELS